MYADASLKNQTINASAKDISTHEESQFLLTAGIIQNDRIHPALGRLNPELNSPPSSYAFLVIPQILTRNIVADS
jgi:hypothetical protein